MISMMCCLETENRIYGAADGNVQMNTLKNNVEPSYEYTSVSVTANVSSQLDSKYISYPCTYSSV